MLHKTRGIVIKRIRYSESSIVAKIYTEKLGMQSYIVNGVRTAKAKFPSSLLQSLSLIDMIVYYKERSNLQRLSEIKASYIYKDLHQNIVKSSIGLFIIEVLNNSIPEEEKNSELFEFAYNSLNFLDESTSNHPNFHLFFMAQLTKYLGFYPAGKCDENTEYFDLKEGMFTNYLSEEYCLDKNKSKIFHALLSSTLENHDTIQLGRLDRNNLLTDLTKYYMLHLDHFRELKSGPVLSDILN